MECLCIVTTKNRPPAVQGCPHPPQPVCMHPGCMHPALMSSPWYHYQDEDMLPQDHGYPRLTHEVQPPELLHVTENTPEGDGMHGYASHSHLSPLKHSVTRCDLTYPSLTAANYMMCAWAECGDQSALQTQLRSCCRDTRRLGHFEPLRPHRAHATFISPSALPSLAASLPSSPSLGYESFQSHRCTRSFQISDPDIRLFL
ncbi:disks large homolog 2-like [Conger conger]|uniref:disks large homolog 2-like n=1 Tax=Conger conger TaxID=82655 RepID=UPI002A5A3329|nr:disks large homolog 2-like [Conger conger]